MCLCHQLVDGNIWTVFTSISGCALFLCPVAFPLRVLKSFVFLVKSVC